VDRCQFFALPLVQGKTIIFATNRLEFLGGCNKVVVMKDGAIDGQGTQAELAKSCETYNELLANMGTVEQGMLRCQRSGDPVRCCLPLVSPTFHMMRTEPEEKPKEEMKDKTLTKKQSRRKKKDVCCSSPPTSSGDAIGW
jgi:energy-coupling factor transporter ATP-binding protein EcfA2